VAERDADGKIIRVTANPRGIDGKLVRQVSSDSTITVNVTGADLFGANGETFESLIALRTALTGNDSDQVRASGPALEESVNRVARASSAHGALMARVETLLGKAGRDLTTYEEGRSRSEDLDMAKAVVDLQKEQLALQSALQAGAHILNMSLLDYLP
jgi:flagellar hook-associated protein 3 FlgL